MNLLHRYIFWTYDRGSFHYDVMVTAILLFIFVSPHYIDFGDRPVTQTPTQRSEVFIKPLSNNAADQRFIYEIRVDDLHGANSEASLRKEILNVVEPIAGYVTLERYTPVADAHGHIVAYDAVIRR